MDIKTIKNLQIFHKQWSLLTKYANTYEVCLEVLLIFTNFGSSNF